MFLFLNKVIMIYSMQYLDTMFVLFVCIYNTFYWIYKNRYINIYIGAYVLLNSMCVSGCTVNLFSERRRDHTIQYNMGIALL